jgi:hypothetical protein
LNEIDVLNHYLKHEFDLLGSGWVNRDLKKQIALNSIHQPFFREITTQISENYQFINWQLDVRSGFEFDVTKQFNEQNIDRSKNVDIKNCWELGRLQHLPQLALAAVNNENREEFIDEFKNQCLDFIASNPVGMGVQWACVMDVGIRVSNLLVAYDIFKQLDTETILNEKFNAIFTNSIYQHGLFIYDNLEHKEGAAGNHYLFNIVGLLFVSNYLVDNEGIEKWRLFAENELVLEFFKQFFKDGGNFEGSTTYHCLSAEAMLYGTSLMMSNSRELSQNHIDLLFKTGLFIKDVIKPNGEFPQFGDNDSGRLFKFSNDNLLNYESLLASFSGLFVTEFEEFGEKYSLNKSIIEQLVANRKLTTRNNKNSIVNFQFSISNYQNSETTEINFPVNVNLEEIKLYAYSDFGIYVYKSDQFYLAISAISNKNMHHSWGHVHNDKLSFELEVNGVSLVSDPGTYTYTAFPKKRKEFRSTKAHHGIIVKEIEQNKYIDLFYLEREVKCDILEVQDLSFTLKANYYGVEHVRKFTIINNKLIITDYCNKPFKVNINQFDMYSSNYGKFQNRK